MTFTIADTTPRSQYTAAGGQTVFTVPFEYRAKADVKVLVDGTLKTLDTDYTMTDPEVSGGGSITFTLAPGVNKIITIYRDMAIARTSDQYTTGGQLPAVVIEASFDDVTMKMQQLERDLGFSSRVGLDEILTPSDMLWPTKSARLGKFARWNSGTGKLEPADISATFTVLTQSIIGAAYRPQSAAEAAAGFTPVNYFWDYGDVRRAGAAQDGTTDARAAMAAIDAVGATFYLEGTYRVASNLTLNKPIIVFPGAKITIDGGVTLTLAAGVFAHGDHWQQIFTGAGAVLISMPQEVHADWWDRTSATCIQQALDATERGSTILLRGKYTQNKTTLQTDEANQTGDIGKALVGVGGPGKRLGDVSPGNWGAEIYLAASRNEHVIDFNGTSQAGQGSRIAFVLRNLKINGNKANQGAGAWNGINFNFIKDVWLENVYVENCKQDGINATNGSSNQIHFGYVEVYGNDRDGFNLGSLGDWSYGVIKAANNLRHGLTGAGNVQGTEAHLYLNTDSGLLCTGTNGVRHWGHVRASFNGQEGVRFSSSSFNYIDVLETESNGTDTGAATSDRVGLRIGGTSTENVVAIHRANDGQGTPTQQYHLYHDASGVRHCVGDVHYDANAVLASGFINAASRSLGDDFNFGGVQAIAYAAAITIDPFLGLTVVVGQLTGNITINDASANKHSDGMRLRVTFLTDGTNRTITAGTRFTIVGSPITVVAARNRTLEFISKSGAWKQVLDSGDVA